MSEVIARFLEGHVFDPEHVEAMGMALDLAMQSLHDTGQPDLIREIIAKRIIEIAKTGERDPQELCEQALLAFGLRAECDDGPFA